MTLSCTRALTATAAALLLSACGATAQPAPGTPRPVDPGQTGSTAALPAVDAAVHPWTPADARFMTDMIGHHAQAVAMARLAESHGAGPQVRTLAERIMAGQTDEIATMRTWLADRGLPAPDPAVMEHSHHATGPDLSMPGMLTMEQMAQLEQARGAEFDRLFLTLMIQHHRGATQMVQRLFGSQGAGQDETVFRFASDVNVDQTTEIARMQRMLADLLFAEDES